MAGGKANKRKTFTKTPRERGPPAESAEEVAEGLSRLAMDDQPHRFPVPLAMWVYIPPFS